MFLIRVLRRSLTPPLVSPLTTRAGRKRKEQCQEQDNTAGMISDNGKLDVTMVTGWFSDVLHHFITVKCVHVCSN